MERLGVVGGMGPESTMAYYRAIIAAARDLRPLAPHLPLLIDSIAVQKVLRPLEPGKRGWAPIHPRV